MLNKISPRGFTIVELVVVIVIIAILATLTAVGFSVIKNKGLDKEYQSSVVSIMTELEKYYDKNGEYPSNNELNPSKKMTFIESDYTAMSSIITGTTASDFVTSDGHSFAPFCTSASIAGCAAYSSASWNSIRSKQFLYISRFNGLPSYEVSISQSPTFPLGWGCKITTSASDPGFVIAWYSNDDKIWNFYRSNRGNIDIVNYSGPSQPGQTCSFTYP